jgi:hypothetical protein
MLIKMKNKTLGLSFQAQGFVLEELVVIFYSPTFRILLVVEYLLAMMLYLIPICIQAGTFVVGTARLLTVPLVLLRRRSLAFSVST